MSETNTQPPAPTMQELLAEIEARQAKAEAEAQAREAEAKAEAERRLAAEQDPRVALQMTLAENNALLRQAINAQNQVLADVQAAIARGEIDPTDGQNLIKQVSEMEGATLVSAVRDRLHETNLDALRYRHAQKTGRVASQVPPDPALSGGAGGTAPAIDPAAQEFFTKLGLDAERIAKLQQELRDVK